MTVQLRGKDKKYNASYEILKMMFESWNSTHVQKAINTDYAFMDYYWNWYKEKNRTIIKAASNYILEKGGLNTKGAIEFLIQVRPDLKQVLSTSQANTWIKKQADRWLELAKNYKRTGRM